MKTFYIKNIFKNRYVRLFIKPVSNLALLSFLFILIPLLYSLLTKNIIEGINKHDLSIFLVEVFVVYFLLIIIECIINVVLQKIKILSEFLIFKHFNKKLFKKMFTLPFIFFENENSGKIVDKFWAIERVSQLLFSGVVNNIVVLPMLVIILVVMFIINIKLTFIAITFILFQLCIVQYFLKQINKVEFQVKKYSEEIFSFLAEHIYNIESIKLESKEDYVMMELLNKQDKYKESRNKLDYLNSFIYTINYMSSLFSFLIMLGFSFYVLHNNYFSLGKIFAYQILYSILFMYTRNLIGFLQSVFINDYNFKLINNILKNSKESLQNIKNKNITLKKYSDLENYNQINIRLNNICFSYNGVREILKNISINISYGQHVVLVGKNGSGKSTLLKILSGLYLPTLGNYMINDINSININPKFLKETISYMDQNTVLFMGSLKDNLTLWNNTISINSIITALNIVNLDYLIKSGGMQVMLNENGSNLSSGERQRLEFARLLIRHSKVILIDEGTSNLDENTQNKILKFLKNLKSTVIQVAHRMIIAKSADIIYVLNDGCIIDYGNHQQLLSRCAIYQDLVKEENMKNAI